MVREDQGHLGVEDENHYHQSTQSPMLVALVVQWYSVIESRDDQGSIIVNKIL